MTRAEFLIIKKSEKSLWPGIGLQEDEQNSLDREIKLETAHHAFCTKKFIRSSINKDKNILSIHFHHKVYSFARDFQFLGHKTFSLLLV